MTFRVRESGRQKVLKEQRKNVHAFVIGTIVPIDEVKDRVSRSVYYNPYKTETFVFADTKEPIHTAEQAWLYSKNVMVSTSS